MRRHILFDLDGTLTDPKEGILGCIRHALERSGRVAPPMEELLWCIGPPLHHSFRILVPEAGDADVERLIALYRERFKPTGQFENLVYPGIPELLRELAEEKPLHLATSKPHVFAKSILEHFGLHGHFRSIHGSELNGTYSEKGDLIRHILGTEGIAPEDALIVGDRKFDVIGAKLAGILAVGITWGYGSKEELTEAGADFLFDDPNSLREFLLR